MRIFELICNFFRRCFTQELEVDDANGETKGLPLADDDLNSLDDYILMSSYDNSDISLLEKKIKNLCNISDLLNIDGTYIGNARQIAKLKEAKKNLEDAINSLENKMPVDIANIDINNAWINLGEIIGEVSSDDLLDELFKRFCLGK